MLLLVAACVAIAQKASWEVILLYCLAFRCRSDTVLFLKSETIIRKISEKQRDVLYVKDAVERSNE